MVEYFDGVEEFPNPLAVARYHALAGLDEIKHALLAEVELAIQPKRFQDWARKLSGKGENVQALIQERSHMVILHGDVGTGKTALAESFGAEASRQLKTPLKLKRLSLGVRGTGHVGEMTTRISNAFQSVVEEAKTYKRGTGASAGIILVIDEADSIAQSRSGTMHHEDRAGVNAVLRGLDDIARDGLPVLTVLCTNRRNALDPAVLRRANLEWEFHRPTKQHVLTVIHGIAKELGLTKEQTMEWAQMLAALDGIGATYSDLQKRILPAVVLDAWRTGQTAPARIRDLTENIGASPRFEE